MDNSSTYMQESWSNLVGAQDVTKLCSVAMNSYLTMMLETGVLHADRALDCHLWRPWVDVIDLEEAF